MTIRVKVKNDDATRQVLVVGSHDGKHQDQQVLQPGEEAEFWVHSTRELCVSEGETVVPDAAPTAPA